MTDTISERAAAQAVKLLGPHDSIRRMRWLLAFATSQLDPAGDACRALYHFLGEDEPEPPGEMAQALWLEMLRLPQEGERMDATERAVLEQRIQDAMGERNAALEHCAVLRCHVEIEHKTVVAVRRDLVAALTRASQLRDLLDANSIEVPE